MWFLHTQGCGSVPTWRGTDLEDGVLGEDFQFVQDIVEQLGGVLRVLSPRVQNGLPDGGGTYVEIWLPTLLNFEDY
jgi:signal transduction histidine kinase